MLFVKSKYALGDKLVKELSTALNGLELLHKTYVRGLCEMYSPEPKAPDANFTIRLTYGNVKSYNPKDGIHYKYYTTLKGVMEKRPHQSRIRSSRQTERALYCQRLRTLCIA